MGIRTLLSNIPEGKIRQLIGTSVCDSVIQYSAMLDIEENIEYPDVLINRYGKDLLCEVNNDVLTQIIWALDEEPLNKLKKTFPNITHNTDDGFRQSIINKIKRQFKYSNMEFSEKILNCLDLNASDYLFDSAVDVVIDPDQNPAFPLHDFQKNIKNRSVTLLLNPNNENRHMIHMPTGSGKTKTAMEIISDFIRTKISLGGFNASCKIIWFAHSSELCEQAYEAFSQTWELRGDSQVNSIKFFGKHKLSNQDIECENKIIFSGFSKMLSALNGRNEEVINYLSIFRDSVDLVIVDEAHRSMASEWNKAIRYFADNTQTQMIGLTATPGRSTTTESRFLSYFFNFTKICLVDDRGRDIDKPVSYLQNEEYLAEIDRNEILTNHDIQLTQPEFERIKKFGGRQKLNEILKDLSKSPSRNKIIVQEVIKENEQSNKVLVFACSVEHCIILQTLLSLNGITSSIVMSSTSSTQRETAINSFKNGELNILINFGVLTTGFDAPTLNTLLISRPVFSIVLYSQMIGRALRGPKNGGNPKNKVITLKDNISLGEANDLFESFNEIWE